jgi:hypothetical protein
MVSALRALGYTVIEPADPDREWLQRIINTYMTFDAGDDWFDRDDVKAALAELKKGPKA